MNEPEIIINGTRLNTAQAVTLRVALGSFLIEMQPGSLGEDEHGQSMDGLYRARGCEIQSLMLESVGE